MSKSLGKILGTNTSQHINKNEANIVPYTRNDGTMGITYMIQVKRIILERFNKTSSNNH